MKVWDFETNSCYERKPSFGSKLHGNPEAVFDFNERRYMTKWSYTKKQRRAFHRCISGLLRAKGRLEKILFMTLTSSIESGMIITNNPIIKEIFSYPACSSEGNKDLIRFLLNEKFIKFDFKKLNYHFNLLVKQIEYTFGFKMEYWKVATEEGFGVLHVLFRVINDKLPKKHKKSLLISKRIRGFIPQKWLSQIWEKIHRAKIVEIHELKGKKSERDIAYYVVGGYVSKQPLKRMSYSQKWVCKGFSKKWKKFLETYKRKAIEVWDIWLLDSTFRDYIQIELNNFFEKG